MAKASWPILRVATGPCRLSSRTKTNGHTQSATASGVSAAPICCGCLLRDVGTCRGRTRGRAAQSSCCGCIRSPVGAEAKSGKSSAMPVHGRTSGEAPFTLTSEGAELRVPMTVKWLIAISAMQSRTCLRPKLPSAATLSEQQRRISKKHRRRSGHKQRPPQHRVQTVSPPPPPPRRRSPLLLSPAFATRAACAAVARCLRPGRAASAAAPSSPASWPGKEGAVPISKSRRLVRLLPVVIAKVHQRVGERTARPLAHPARLRRAAPPPLSAGQRREEARSLASRKAGRRPRILSRGVPSPPAGLRDW